MAKNITKTFGAIGQHNVGLVVTVPTTNTTTVVPKAGTPCLAGKIPGVAENDVDTSTGNTNGVTVLNTYCIAELSVVGKVTGGGNGAINAGDRLFMQTDGTIDANSTGSGALPFGNAFGNALIDLSGTVNKLGTDTRTGQLVASGATTVIRVWVGQTK